MAGFDANFFVRFQPIEDGAYRYAGSSWWHSSHSTLTDGNAEDLYFSAGETLSFTITGSAYSGAYLGTMTSGENSYFAIQQSSGSVLLFGWADNEDDWDSQILENFSPADLNTADFATCFLRGTRIATPTGPVAIEDLAAGDLVLQPDGTALPVRWIGRQTIQSRFADRQRSFPIRIQAGALGQGLPRHDLFVSPDHALLLEGLLVQAGALVDGHGIIQLRNPPARFTYFHIELERHALVLAEGAAAESFVDNVTRQRFDNYAEYAAQFGEAGAATGESEFPRVKSARQLPAGLRARLAAAQPVADSATLAQAA